jgi:hypothetical protein
MSVVRVVIRPHGPDIKTPVYVRGGGAFVLRQDPIRLSVDTPRGPTRRPAARKFYVMLRGIPAVISRTAASGIS